MIRSWLRVARSDCARTTSIGASVPISTCLRLSPAAVKKSFDAMVEAEATFKADLEKLLKNEGHMPEDKFLVLSRKGKRLGVAFASTPRGEGEAASLKFKIK